MENKEKKPCDRLEDALITFIERTVEKDSPEYYEIEAIPAVADVLCKLWGYH